MSHEPENEACMCVYCMGPDKDEPDVPWAYIASLNALVVAVFAMVHL